MEKIIYNGVDVFNPLEGKLDKVIECFVEFYGEDRREEITQKLKSDTTYIFLPKAGDDLHDTFAEVKTFFDLKIEDVYKKLDNEFGVDLEIWRYGDNSFASTVAGISEKILNNKHLTACEINIVKRFAKAYKIKLKRKLFEYDIYTKKVARELALEMERYYNVFVSKYRNEIRDVEVEKNDIINRISRLIPNVTLIEREMEEDIKQKALECFEQLLISKNISLDSPEIDNYFKIYFEIIKQERLSVLCTDRQKEDYLSLFKFLGIDYGDNYFDYYRDDVLLNLIFDKELMWYIRTKHLDLYKKKKNDNFFLLYALEQISSLNFKYDCDLQDIRSSLYNFVYVKPKTGGFIFSYLDSQNKLKHICVLGDYFSMGRTTFTHEANHIIETTFLSEDQQAYYLKSGFDVVIHEKREDVKLDLSNFMRGEHRKYETISEIINEYIASKIAFEMENDFEICGNAIQRAYYEYGYTTFYKFLEENLETIIKCRRSKDRYAMADYMSHDELDEVAQIAEDMLYAKDFDIKKVINEIVEKEKLKGITEIECANIIRVKRLGLSNSLFVKWSNEALRLFGFVRRVDEISEKFKQATHTSKNCAINLKKVASEEMDR